MRTTAQIGLNGCMTEQLVAALALRHREHVEQPRGAWHVGVLDGVSDNRAARILIAAKTFRPVYVDYGNGALCSQNRVSTSDSDCKCSHFVTHCAYK
jgi:hypothetical protein